MDDLPAITVTDVELVETSDPSLLILNHSPSQSRLNLAASDDVESLLHVSYLVRQKCVSYLAEIA